jgi:hypothetical protein
MRGVYVGGLRNTSVSVLKTLAQINVASTCAVQVFEIRMSFFTTASQSIRLRISKRTSAGAGTPFTPVRKSGAPTALSAMTVDHTAEGGLGDVLYDQAINLVTGMNRLEIPEGRVDLAPGDRLAVDFPDNPTSAVITWCEIEFNEIG